MARPLKLSVDFFPHDAYASESKTLSILENYYGAEGYATWFKLLEIISRTRNHVIDLRNPVDKEFIASKIKLTIERFTEITTKLAELEAIDPELFSQDIIWCQHLIDRLKPVYDNRNQTLFRRDDVISMVDNRISSKETPVSSPISAATKGTKGTKVKELPIINNGSIFSLFEENFSKLTRATSEMLNDLIDTYNTEKVLDAMKIAISANKRSLRYVEGVLKNDGTHKGNSKRGGTRLPTEYTEPPHDPQLEAFAEAARKNDAES